MASGFGAAQVAGRLQPGSRLVRGAGGRVAARANRVVAGWSRGCRPSGPTPVRCGCARRFGRRRPRGGAARGRRGRRTDAGRTGRRALRTRTTGSPTRCCGSCTTCCTETPLEPVFDAGVPAAVGLLRGLQPGLRRGFGRGGGRGCGRDRAGLPPGAGAGDAARAAARPRDRPFLAHAVGAGRLLPAAAGRHRRAGAARDAGRRPARLPHPALGRRVLPRAATPLLGRARRHGDRRARAGRRRGLPARAVARGRRRGADGGPAGGDRGGRRTIVRVDRTELSKNIVRGLLAYRELLAESRPEWRERVVARRLRLPLAAGPRRVPGLHGRGAAGRGGDQRGVRHAGVDAGRAEPEGRLRAVAGGVPAGGRGARRAPSGTG